MNGNGTHSIKIHGEDITPLKGLRHVARVDTIRDTMRLIVRFAESKPEAFAAFAASYNAR